MSDENYENEIARIRKFYDKWAAILGLNHHVLYLLYDRERKQDEYNTAATTTTAWQYRLGHITFYTPATIENDDRQLEHIVLHEICHVLISPASQATEDNSEHFVELATENVARALEDAYAAGQRDFK